MALNQASPEVLSEPIEGDGAIGPAVEDAEEGHAKDGDAVEWGLGFPLDVFEDPFGDGVEFEVICHGGPLARGRHG